MSTSQSTNDKIPCSFCILKRKCKTFGHRPQAVVGHNYALAFPWLGEQNFTVYKPDTFHRPDFGHHGNNAGNPTQVVALFAVGVSLCNNEHVCFCYAVLPKFEVTITPPSFVAYTDRSNITATVCARQVYFNPHRNKYVKSILFAYCKHTNSVLTHMAVHLQYTVNLLHTNKCYHDSILEMYFHKLTPQKYNSRILLLCYSRLHT